MPSPAAQPLSEMIGAYLRRYPAMPVDVRAVPTAGAAAGQGARAFLDCVLGRPMGAASSPGFSPGSADWAARLT